jgi:NAD(P)-dependent dehydrogenase (short-subunit alcohol dehydrogenase family)
MSVTSFIIGHWMQSLKGSAAMADRSSSSSSARVVLVTGASSGFGRAIAKGLHQQGWVVYGTTRQETDGRSPDGFRMLTMDITTDPSVSQGVARVLSEFGRIDALVNNAAMGIAGALEDTTIEEACAQFDTNFFSVHRLCRAVLPAMREQRSGRIVNMSSLGGFVSVPFQGFYCASKFAVEAYTEALRMEVMPFGIHVSMIEPGDYSTGFTANRRVVAAAGFDSPYAERCQRAVTQFARDESANEDIGPVARKALALLVSPKPPLRNPVASAVQRLLVALRPAMPHSLFEYLMMNIYGIR